MKIIFNGRYISKAILNLTIEDNSPCHSILPETALILRSLPFFYPSLSKDLCALVQPGVKINKLGKEIQSKFAKSYYNEIALFVHFIGLDLLKELAEKASNYLPAIAYDYCLNVGPFIEANSVRDKISCQLGLNEQFTDEQFNWQDLIDNSISEASHFYTLKTGDIILAGEGVMIPHIAIGDKIDIRFENNDYLTSRVK